MIPKSQIFSCFFLFCVFFVQGQIKFSNPQPLVSSAELLSNPVFVYSIDIDRDNDQDILSVTSGGEIVWYENLDGKSKFGTKRILAKTGMAIKSAFMADMDGDADMDIVLKTIEDTHFNGIVWYENTEGEDNFSNYHAIADNIFSIAMLRTSDIDGDGDQDVLLLSYGEDRIILYENLWDGVVFGDARCLVDYTNEITGFAVADFDGDNNIELVMTSADDDLIVLYDNMDGKGTFESIRIISKEFDCPYVCEAEDINSDGYVDIVVFDNYSHIDTFWFKNKNGRGVFGNPELLPGAGLPVTSDLDGDGVEDLVSLYNFAFSSKLHWFKNIDKTGIFGKKNTFPYPYARINSICISDIDTDGDMDVIAGSGIYNAVIIYKNNGVGVFKNTQIISNSLNHPRVTPGDFDNDGDIDIITTNGYGKVVSYMNSGGKDIFQRQKLIMLNTLCIRTIEPADIDGDGDLDITLIIGDRSLLCGDRGLGWLENTDGKGTFSEMKEISSGGYSGPFNITDIDSDGDLDIIAASGWIGGVDLVYPPSFRGKIFWFENTDGKGHFRKREAITDFAGTCTSLLAKDVDGDNNPDIVFSLSYGKIAWCKNRRGKANFGEEKTITYNDDGAYSLLADDLDGDNDLDIFWVSRDSTDLSFTNYRKNLFWVENLNGKGKFGKRKVVDSELKKVESVVLSDLDNDGDVDILASIGESLVWYENMDGKGNYSSRQILSDEIAGKTSFIIADFNNNKIADILLYSSNDVGITFIEGLTVEGDDNIR